MIFFRNSLAHRFSPHLIAKFDIFKKIASPINSKTSTDGVSTDDDYTRTRLALGLQIGWKKVSDSGFIFEFDFGGGRALVDNIKFDSDRTTLTEDDVPSLNIDALIRIAIGYRISK